MPNEKLISLCALIGHGYGQEVQVRNRLLVLVLFRFCTGFCMTAFHCTMPFCCGVLLQESLPQKYHYWCLHASDLVIVRYLRTRCQYGYARASAVSV